MMRGGFEPTYRAGQVPRLALWSLGRHPVLPYVGWAIVAFVFVSMATTALYGAIELYIRSEIAKGIAGVPRGTSPAENTKSHPQRPFRSKLIAVCGRFGPDYMANIAALRKLASDPAHLAKLTEAQRNTEADNGIALDNMIVRVLSADDPDQI